jgi:hypothetical protein
VRRDLGAQRSQLRGRESLALRLQHGELELRGDEARGVLRHARVLDADPPAVGVQPEEAPHTGAADDERRHDRRPKRAQRLRAAQVRLDVDAVLAARPEQLADGVAAVVMLFPDAVVGEDRLAVGERHRRSLQQRAQGARSPRAPSLR